MASKIQNAYIAGIIDGEGSIFIRCQNNLRRRANGCSSEFFLVLDVGNTDKNLINYLYSLFGGTTGRRKDKRPNTKPMFNWRVTSKKAMSILEAVYPYMIVKRQQVDIARKFQQTKIQTSERRYNKLSTKTIKKRIYLMNALSSINRYSGRIQRRNKNVCI